MNDSINIALLQILPTGSIEQNMEKGVRCCKEASARGADIALFPEMWSSGYAIPHIVVTVCLLMGGFITVSTVWEYHRLDVPMPADVVLALVKMWFSELLILAGRQILGSDALPWSKKTAYSGVSEDDVLGV